jgi:hypothetical protein
MSKQLYILPNVCKNKSIKEAAGESGAAGVCVSAGVINWVHVLCVLSCSV